MAKFSKTIKHDYMRFKATFADGTALSANYSRNGHTIGLEPYDPETARKVANHFHNIDRSLKGTEFNLMHVFEIIEPIAQKAGSLDAMLAGMTAAFQRERGIDISRPLDLQVRERTTANLGKKGRSIALEIRFENGEDFEISFAGKSVGIRMKPDHSIFSSRIVNMAFGLMSLGDPAEAAQRFKEAAEAAPDVEGWIENVKAGYRHADAPAAPAPAGH